MAGITLKGEIKKITAITNPSQNNPDFTKREVWLEIDQDQDYPQTVSIELLKDKCAIVEKYAVGDVVEMDVNIRGNIAKDGNRCFNSMNAWRMNGMASGSAPMPEPEQTAMPEPEPDGGTETQTNPDDLPF